MAVATKPNRLIACYGSQSRHYQEGRRQADMVLRKDERGGNSGRVYSYQYG